MPPSVWSSATTVTVVILGAIVTTATGGQLLKRCEVARELALRQVPQEQIGDWLCIAEHGSGYNVSAVNLKYKRFGGSGYYGLFQVIDAYGCAKSGSICGLRSCEALRDDDLDDDIDCMLQIHRAYGRELGDGFAAWPVHKRHCRPPGGLAADFGECLDEELIRVQAHFKRKRAKAKSAALVTMSSRAAAKVYDRCELALELRDRHRVPEEQLATWVCIAYHESRFNTSAEGRLNADGSGDHGLFQISDIYWCATGGIPGKACGVTCDAMRDNDIADDVRCIRTIYDEHRRISGNGFHAWTVYRPYCEGREATFVHNCFDDPTTANRPRPGIVAPTPPGRKSSISSSDTGKVYDRCELANDLLHKFQLPRDQVATWVCIAYHESRFNTSAEGRLNADGSGDHGLFQISDIYWCSPPGNGWACSVSCADLRDNDITDDVRCVRTIYEEHQRLSGDGFNAWSVYKPYCQGKSESFTRGCFGDEVQTTPVTAVVPRPAITAPTRRTLPKHSGGVRGKVYTRCELAKELHLKHGYSPADAATWTCIAKYQSNFNTSAIGGDLGGVQFHGMFQLSDEYWCSPPGHGWVCGLTCDQLRDDDISDDLACMRHIYDEHQRISGDGYNAWAVYQPYCKGKSASIVSGCFEEDDNAIIPTPPTIRRPGEGKNFGTGKVYERCELARELYHRHQLPFDQIATWVCIAHRESNYNVSAIGRLNADGSGDHGLFQISDIYWCSPPGRGWVCGLTCAELEDNDLTDDIECMRTIFEEHTRLSGDGFNAWAVYRPYCKGRSDHYIEGCFEEPSTTPVTVTKPIVTTVRRTTTETTNWSSTTPVTVAKPSMTNVKRATTQTTTPVIVDKPITTIVKRTTSKSTTRTPSVTTSVPKSTTNLYEFYLKHFGRPAMTTFRPTYTFKPFTARKRSTAADSDATTEQSSIAVTTLPAQFVH